MCVMVGKTRGAWLAVIALMLVSGCKSTDIVRNTTVDLADEIDRLNQSMTEYRTVLEEDSTRRVNRLAGERVALARLEHEANERMQIWLLVGNADAVELIEGIEAIALGALEAERDLRDRLKRERDTLAGTQKKFDAQQNTLASLSKQLRALAKERDLRQELEALAKFGEEAYNRLDILRQKLEAADESDAAVLSDQP